MNDPTQANDAETFVLGAAMSGADIDELAAILEPSDFYAPYREEVWKAILRVHHAGNKPDMVTVRMALDEAKVRHDPLDLHSFVTWAPVAANPAAYAEEVANAAGSRLIQEAGTRLRQIGSTPGALDDKREHARKAVDEATAGKARSRARTLADALPQVIDQAQHGMTDVLGTGWDDLDRTIGGLAPGRLVVIGARPGVGKSIAGTNLALHFAHHHAHAVLVASLEMPEREVTQRLLAAHATVNLTGLQMGYRDEAGWKRIAASMSELEALPLTIDDAPDQSITSIRRAARDIQRRREDLALIVVDYLQLVRPADPRANRAEQVTDISRGLKLLARETGACVVAMVQVNREGTKHADGRPRMTDLREGGIENDADQVILMHQPDEEIPELEVITEKNRHGPKGICRLAVQGHYARLASVQWSPTKGIA